MSPQFELLTSTLDLIAFFLVTPVVIGEARIAVWYAWMGRAVYWLRTVWFNRDDAPLTWASLASTLASFGVVILIFLGIQVSTSAVTLALISGTLIPAAFIILYGIISRLEQRSSIFRALAILGAVLFVAGKLIAIGSAYNRL